MAFIPSKDMIGRLEESNRRFEIITEQLSLPQIISKRDEFQKLSRERSNLENTVTHYVDFKKKFEDYEGARSLLESGDTEFRQMAMLEINELEPALEKLQDELQILLLPKDPNDEKNVVLEIRAGVGGDEASLFAGDLFGMYRRYADSKRWKVELLSLSEGTAGGFKEIIALIEGERAYSQLKYESGVHRVQRVPKTEAQGRVHTSTITVAVLPEAEEIDLVIADKDLRIDVFRAGGHGGQSVNTTDSAVRITHLPTNEVVICQDEKSQLKNKNKAMKVLRSRLLDRMIEDQHKEISAARRAQVGAGMRNERIRTYNFPQGRVTDHRVGLTIYNIDETIQGKIDPFIQALNNHYQTIALRGESAVAKPTSDDED